jgi:hypothetical protein
MDNKLLTQLVKNATQKQKKCTNFDFLFSNYLIINCYIFENHL